MTSGLPNRVPNIGHPVQATSSRRRRFLIGTSRWPAATAQFESRTLITTSAPNPFLAAFSNCSSVQGASTSAPALPQIAPVP